jgi:hypothetical protein
MATMKGKRTESSTRRAPDTGAKEEEQSHEGTQTNESQERQSKPSGWRKKPLEMPDVLKDLPETTSRVVLKAASILEEEIAMGITAAKEIERRYVNVNKARSKDPEEVMPRFRRDAHEVVDIFIDLVSAASASAVRLAENTVRMDGSGRPSKKESTGEGKVPTLTIPQPINAGESSQVEMALENDSEKPTGEIGFYASALLNASGNRIPARQVTFTPSSLIVGPKKSGKVTVGVKVPRKASPGVYSGLIQATNLNHLKAVLVVPVK